MNMNWLDGAWMAKQDEVQKVMIQWKIVTKGQYPWAKARKIMIAGELDNEDTSFSGQYEEAVRVKALREAEEKRIGKKIWSKGAPPNGRKELAAYKEESKTWKWTPVGEE